MSHSDDFPHPFDDGDHGAHYQIDPDGVDDLWLDHEHGSDESTLDHDIHIADPAHIPGMDTEWPTAEPVTDLPDLLHYEPSPEDHVIGDPAEAMDHWHQQELPDSCAIVAQEMVLETLTGEEFAEGQLVHEAFSNGWYTPGGGTSLADCGNLLEAHGLGVSRHFEASLDDLRTILQGDGECIVAVDADELWNPGTDVFQDEFIGDFNGIPGQDANHAVSVIGIEEPSPGQVMVILNDPGHPDGRGLMVPAEEFMSAWSDSGHYLVAVNSELEANAFAVGPGADGPSLAGYYNGDGTYHYTSDNTDRDPETGAIVRRW